MGTPIYSFQAFVDVATFRHFSEHADLFHFELRAQCQIRAIPFTKYTETDEIFLLFFHTIQCVFTTFIAKIQWAHFMTIQASVFDNRMLDRKTMCIPTRNIWCVMALHRFIFHHNVF